MNSFEENCTEGRLKSTQENHRCRSSQLNCMIMMSNRKFTEPLKLPGERDCHEVDVRLHRKKRNNEIN